MKTLILIGYIVAAILGTIWKGYVTLVLWTWFALPVGLPHVSLSMIIGLETLIRFMTYTVVNTKPDVEAVLLRYSNRPKVEETDEEKVQDFISLVSRSFAVPAVFLFTGYIISLFL
jgi:hypothetical protein